MKRRCAEKRTAQGGSSTTVGRLLADNMRLRRACSQKQELVTRYEVLLREGDHRIKNSLQIVASLISIQARREQSSSARSALQVAAARIQAVARIHDSLQLAPSQDLVDLGALIGAMSNSLHAMAGDPDAVKIVVTTEPVETPIDMAQPLVLAVNELIINALRHAFPEKRSGSITVNVSQADGELRIHVADDGVGLPADYLDGNGYGMNLVRAMITKIGGLLHVDSGAGTRFTLSAPHATS